LIRDLLWLCPLELLLSYFFSSTFNLFNLTVIHNMCSIGSSFFFSFFSIDVDFVEFNFNQYTNLHLIDSRWLNLPFILLYVQSFVLRSATFTLNLHSVQIHFVRLHTFNMCFGWIYFVLFFPFSLLYTVTFSRQILGFIFSRIYLRFSQI